ncbi:hypothetical protein [Streptomyces sp. NRRL WC-3742]|uniref:hypothetical protein n=1 Tax=Streptomyces sp. NRRL WC-3742 TaxID=1463934 RepID=UPI0004CAF02F|nr:hypothetical protein [Streptomyces sp. NRRL WC-3742]
MPENAPKPTPAETAEQFAAIVADLPDHEVAASADEFGCEDCGGVLEAAAPLWFEVYRRADGTPGLYAHGVGVEAATVSCKDCGRDAGDHLDRLITDAMEPWDNALSGLEV